MKIAFFIHHEWTGDKFAFYGETLPSPLPGDVEFELDWDFAAFSRNTQRA